jgi:hypothetical protein
VVAAGLEDDHLPARLCERGCDHGPAGAGADHHHVGLERLAVLGHARLDRLGDLRRRRGRAGIAEHVPVRVAAGLRVRHAVGEEERHRDERLNPAGGLGRGERQVAQDLLARYLRRHARYPLRVDRVEQLAQAGAQLVVERRDHLLDGLGHAEVGGRPGPEAERVRLALDARDDGVAEQAQRRALRVRQAHASLLEDESLERTLYARRARVRTRICAVVAWPGHSDSP